MSAIESGSSHSDILEGRPQLNAGPLLADFKTATNFRERDGKMQIARDVIGMVRKVVTGGVETYSQKLKREETKGHREAASYGYASLNGHEFVEAATHWDFFAGTFGVVVGEKIAKAADLAARKRLPLVAFYSSGGARQQENFPALVQMTRLTYALERQKQVSKRPYVAILVHQVWGGLSASAVPRADVTLALRGTNHGFAGGRVIESYTYKAVPEGTQSAEASVRARNLDMIIEDEATLMDWLKKFMDMDESIKNAHNKNAVSSLRDLRPIAISKFIRFDFETKGFITPVFDNDHVLLSNKREEETQNSEQSEESLLARYEALASDPRRPDTEFLLAHCFQDVVPLYSYECDGKILRYPAIIAALGKIGEQPFLIIGNQPTYQKLGDKIRKIPSSPTPSDYDYVKRMLDFGERLGYPAVFITDTLGAKPTLEAEAADQSRKISDTILKSISYKHPVISIVIGALGSGGGLATTPIGDHVAATEKSMVFVAEPVSATSILYNKSRPEKDEVEATIESMRATAKDQLELGLIDAVIPEPWGGAQTNPVRAAELIRNHIAKSAYELLAHSDRERLKRRFDRIRNLRGIPLKNG